jgi:hypothetical protein
MKKAWKVVIGLAEVVAALILLNLLFGHATMNLVNAVGNKLVEWVR